MKISITIKKRTLRRILKICIAMFYILLGLLLAIKFAKYADYQWRHHEIVFCFVMVVAELIPLWMMIKGGNYIKSRISKLIDHLKWEYVDVDNK